MDTPPVMGPGLGASGLVLLHAHAVECLFTDVQAGQTETLELDIITDPAAAFVSIDAHPFVTNLGSCSQC